MDAAIGEDQTKHLFSLSAMGIDIPNTAAAAAVGIDTHTKTDNVRLVQFLFPVAEEMVQLVTNQRAITIMTTAQK